MGSIQKERWGMGHAKVHLWGLVEERDEDWFNSHGYFQTHIIPIISMEEGELRNAADAKHFVGCTEFPPPEHDPYPDG